VVPALTLHISPEFSYLIIMVCTITILSLLFNGSMYLVYTKKIDFFEQYRVNKDVSLYTIRNLGLGRRTLKNGGNSFGEALE
jgi:hypothetical protein